MAAIFAFITFILWYWISMWYWWLHCNFFVLEDIFLSQYTIFLLCQCMLLPWSAIFLFRCQNEKWYNFRAAPIHILVSYAKKAIDEESSCKTLVGSVIFVCRQLYSSCIGLLVMEKYHLHELLYTSWRAVWWWWTSQLCYDYCCFCHHHHHRCCNCLLLSSLLPSATTTTFIWCCS